MEDLKKEKFNEEFVRVEVIDDSSSIMNCGCTTSCG